MAPALSTIFLELSKYYGHGNRVAATPAGIGRPRKPAANVRPPRPIPDRAANNVLGGPVSRLIFSGIRAEAALAFTRKNGRLAVAQGVRSVPRGGPCRRHVGGDRASRGKRGSGRRRCGRGWRARCPGTGMDSAPPGELRRRWRRSFLWRPLCGHPGPRAIVEPIPWQNRFPAGAGGPAKSRRGSAPAPAPTGLVSRLKRPHTG